MSGNKAFLNIIDSIKVSKMENKASSYVVVVTNEGSHVAVES